MTLARAISAQATRVAADAPAPHVARDVFAQRVTVTLDGTSLRTAVNAIANASGVRVQYFGDMIDTVTKVVTLHANQLPLGVAFDRVLAGTGLQAVPHTDDFVMIKAVVVAQDGVVVGVVVEAKTKRPLANATVLLDDATKGTVTNSDGEFRLAAAPGSHTIRVRVLGFAHGAQQVTVTEGQTTRVQFALEAAASVLDELVVTGTVVATERKAITTPITVIDAAEIERRGITRVEQLFRGEIPGVIALDLGSAAYATRPNGIGDAVSTKAYSRGASTLDGKGGMLKTYIDGVELVDPNYLGTLDPKSIERIEIVSGPQAATIYGSGAMGGVMQIFTKKGAGRSTPDVTVSMKYGMLQNSMSAGLAPLHDDVVSLAGGSGPSLTYSANGSYRYTGQWQPLLFNRLYAGSIGVTHTSGPLSASGSVSSTVTSNGTYNGNNSPIGFEQRINDGTYDPNWNFGLGRANGFSQRIFRSSSQMLTFNADYRISNAWQHHLTIGQTRSDFMDDPRAPNFTAPRDSMFLTGVANAKRRSLGYNTTISLEAGNVVSSAMTFGWTGSSGDRVNIDGCFVTLNAPAYTPCGSTLNVTRSVFDRSVGGFGQWRVGLWNQLFITLGLRGEQSPSYGRDHKTDWTPTQGIAYSFERGNLSVKLLGSYGRATRPPAPDARIEKVAILNGYNIPQYSYQIPALALTPEYSRGPQGGIEVYYGNIASISINHYQQMITDLIRSQFADSIYVTELASGTSYYLYNQQYQNVGSIRQYGWEGVGSLNLGPLALKGTYSWNESRIRYNTVVSDAGKAFNGVPTHFANASASYANGGTSIMASVNYVGGYANTRNDEFFQDAVRARLPMYVLLKRYQNVLGWREASAKTDLVASQRLNSKVSLTLNITNLANSFDSDYGALSPTLGRQTLLGASIRFR